MGIHTDTLDFFWESMGDIDVKKKWMLELGNQSVRVDAKKKYGIRSGYTKVYFLGLRCNHHAIDWNGLHGAVPLDMTKPIPVEKYINAFDIITDFGCMEHISGYKRDDLPIDKSSISYSPNEARANQWQAWKNIHDMGKVGCIYIHTVPFLDSVPRHGFFHYTLEFFSDLCKVNDYKPILLRLEQHDPRHHRRDYVFSSYTKTNDKPFAPDVEEFKGWLHR